MMKFLITCVFIFLKLTLFAQIDSAEAFLNRAWEKELALQSGEVTIKDGQYYRDSLIFRSEKRLTFFHEPGNSAHYYLLDDGKEGTFFSNGEAIEYHYRGFRRQWPDPRWPGAYRREFRNIFDELCLGFEPEVIGNRPLKKVGQIRQEFGDSLITWDLTNKKLRIKTVEFHAHGIGRYQVYEYEYNADTLLTKATVWIVNIFPDTSFTDNIVRQYTYSKLNEVPYFDIRRQLNEYQKAPLLSVIRPERMEIKHYPEVGMVFPDLVLMDGIGRKSNLSSLSGPKILIYPFSPLYSDLDVFPFVDSMEDAHPGWNFMIITQHTIDDLDDHQKDHPTINSFYLASVVEGLELNGWPIWFILDEDNRVLAENHGYHVSRNKEFSEWIKEHLTDD